MRGTRATARMASRYETVVQFAPLQRQAFCAAVVARVLPILELETADRESCDRMLGELWKETDVALGTSHVETVKQLWTRLPWQTKHFGEAGAYAWKAMDDAFTALGAGSDAELGAEYADFCAEHALLAVVEYLRILPVTADVRRRADAARRSEERWQDRACERAAELEPGADAKSRMHELLEVPREWF